MTEKKFIRGSIDSKEDLRTIYLKILPADLRPGVAQSASISVNDIIVQCRQSRIAVQIDFESGKITVWYNEKASSPVIEKAPAIVKEDDLPDFDV